MTILRGILLFNFLVFSPSPSLLFFHYSSIHSIISIPSINVSASSLLPLISFVSFLNSSSSLSLHC